MNYYKNDIRHVKGDTYSSGLTIENLHQDLDSAYFTCRDTLNDTGEVLFQCSLDNGITLVDYDIVNDIRQYAIRIDPSKTINIQSGTYYYDLEVGVNNDVFTIMKGKFIIEQDCTRINEDGSEDEVISV